MADSPVAVFDELVRLDLPEHTPVLFDTVCVLGGSIAGLLAARVLSDHARRVLIIERDDQVNVDGRPRAGVPHDRQVHGVMAGGLAQIERWLPGFVRELSDRGGVFTSPERTTTFMDGHEQPRTGADNPYPHFTRPFFESRIRSRVLALPNVSTLAAHVTGLEYRNDTVSAVRYRVDDVESAMDVDFVVDAMGLASKLSDWVEQAGYDRPRLQRMQTGVGYATALFERPADRRPTAVFSRHSPLARPDDLAIALLTPVENSQWLIGLTTFGKSQPPKTIEEFRAVCATLPPAFAEVAAGALTREVLNFHQADSRRRDYVGLSRFPARLVSVGDAVTSLNATYAQGMSSAALHASCLSRYLVGEPNCALPAAEFFALQEVAVDAVWAFSTGADEVRQDIINGTEVPEEVQKHRWAMGQIMQAASRDEAIAEACKAVAFVFAHPFTLADPALLEQAIAVNQQASANA